jgi:hypothetical protein
MPVSLRYVLVMAALHRDYLNFYQNNKIGFYGGCFIAQSSLSICDDHP